jgi:hypothetical protein
MENPWVNPEELNGKRLEQPKSSEEEEGEPYKTASPQPNTTENDRYEILT